MEISIKWNICRVCLQEEKKPSKKGDIDSVQFVNLFKVNKKLATQILELSGVLMKPDDCLPDKICTKCVTTINSAVHFRKTCRSSNTYLQSILEQTKSASNLFKPEISSGQTNNEDGDSKTQPSTLEDEVENNAEAENETGAVCNKKSKENSETSHNLYSVEDQEADIELEINDGSNYMVELEEIIEMPDEDELHSEPMVDDVDEGSSVFENTAAENNKDHSIVYKSETSQFQKLSANNRFWKQRNSKEKKHNTSANDSSYSECTKKEQVDYSDNDEDFKDFEELVSEKFMDFISVEQEENTESNNDEPIMMVDEEEQINDNEDQAQVSSTVDTKEDFEYYEETSNISNLTTLKSENFSNCSISSTKASEAAKEPHANNRKLLQSHSSVGENKSPTVFAKRKMKRNLFKSATYDQVQVCVCEICGNRFTSQNKMKLHMKIHLQYKNHQCELCCKSFITACNLQAHMRIHTGEKPFECKYCGRRFNDRSSHIRHERTHTNEKPFECFDCGKSFSLATTLQNHTKVHSNERSYRCEPCGKSFKLPHHLKKHQSTTLHRSVLQIADDES